MLHLNRCAVIQEKIMISFLSACICMTFYVQVFVFFFLLNCCWYTPIGDVNFIVIEMMIKYRCFHLLQRPTAHSTKMMKGAFTVLILVGVLRQREATSIRVIAHVTADGRLAVREIDHMKQVISCEVFTPGLVCGN